MDVRALVVVVVAGLVVGCSSAAAPRAGSVVSPMPSPAAGSASPKARASSTDTMAQPFRCPPTFAAGSGSTYLSPTRPGLAASIVPDDPVQALVCRYGGSFGSTLVQSATLTDTATLVAVLNSATQMQMGASYACGAGTGQSDLLLFSYTNGPPVGVTVELDGCAMESNGVRLAYADTAQRAALAGVAGSPSPIP